MCCRTRRTTRRRWRSKRALRGADIPECLPHAMEGQKGTQLGASPFSLFRNRDIHPRVGTVLRYLGGPARTRSKGERWLEGMSQDVPECPTRKKILSRLSHSVAFCRMQKKMLAVHRARSVAFRGESDKLRAARGPVGSRADFIPVFHQEMGAQPCDQCRCVSWLWPSSRAG